MRKLEYKVVEHEKRIPDEAYLNRMGEEGWELVMFGKPENPASYSFELPRVMIFKREKEPQAPPVCHVPTAAPENEEKISRLLEMLGTTRAEAEAMYDEIWGGRTGPHPMSFFMWLSERAWMKKISNQSRE